MITNRKMHIRLLIDTFKDIDQPLRTLFQRIVRIAYVENLNYCGITRSSCDSTAFL